MISILKPYVELFFPTVCACCGISLEKEGSHLCIWCANRRFEQADRSEPEILPESVYCQYSMWKFDKGGYLQQLLHSLKYDHLKSVGIDLGTILGRTFLDSCTPELNEYFQQSAPVIVPVPIHKSKLRKRGYNQAEALARGFSTAVRWEVAEPRAVIRVKKTRSQTGLSTVQRAENIRGAFQLSDGGLFENRVPVIIDDVFTTGATVFELARVLQKKSLPAVIVTAAKT